MLSMSEAPFDIGRLRLASGAMLVTPKGGDSDVSVSGGLEEHSDSSTRMEHARLHGVRRYPDDLGQSATDFSW
jgi:hypothetical protein